MQFSYKLFFVFFFNSFFSYSQIEIKGIVKDSTNVIGFANVFLTNLNNEILTGTITDENGVFNLPVQKGKYKLTVSFIGYVDWVINISPTSNLDLGVITLIESSNRLDQVIVTAKKPTILRKIDRLVFNVENSIVGIGGDAIDALKVTPRIRVQSDAISMLGKSKMMIMVDDRLMKISGDDLINFLKTITSDDIKSIEVITTPPAKYDAEGNIGIVNIKLKKQTKNRWNTTINFDYIQSKYSQFKESISIVYNKDNFSFYSSLLHTDGLYSFRTENGNTYYPDKYTNSSSKIKSNNKNNTNLNFGLDYSINTRFSVGFQYFHSNSKVSNIGQNSTKIFSIKNYSIQTFSDGVNKRTNNNLNFHSTYKLDSIGSNVTFNSDYFNYNSNKDLIFKTNEYEDFTNYINDSYNSANNLSKQDISNYSIALDVKQVLKKINISYGSKISNTKSTSNIGYYDLTSGTLNLVLDKSDKFKYTENIQAFYISGHKNFSKNFETKFGLRIESAQTEGYSFNLKKTSSNNYTKLFPTLYLLYIPNKNSAFSLNYNKRVTRPNYKTLNPFVRYINPYTTSEGNPFLQPYYTDNIELTYSHKNNWSNTLYFRKANNIYGQVTYISSDNINSETKRLNYYNQFSIGLYESYSFKPLKRVESYNSINIFYKKIKSFLPETASNYDGFSSFIETNNNYVLNKNKTYFISFDFWYQFPQYYNIYKFKGYYNFNLGFKALWFDKKLIFTMSASDIFRSFKMKNTSVFNSINTSFKNYENRQSLRFSLKYSFGKNTNKIKSINSSNQEEKGRAN